MIDWFGVQNSAEKFYPAQSYMVEINKEARELLRAMNDRNDYRKRPRQANIVNLQNIVHNVQNRLQRHRDLVVQAMQARYPQRQNVRRFQDKSLLALVFKDGTKTYVIRRSGDVAGEYAKFWDLLADEAIFVHKKTMTVAWGPRAGESVKINEHWTSSGVRV